MYSHPLRLVNSARLQRDRRTSSPFPVPCPRLQVLLDFDPGCLDVADSAGDTALHCAVDVGDPALLQFLLDCKPNVNVQNLHQSEYASGNWLLHGEALEPLDKTPLHLAIDDGENECVELLLKAGQCQGGLMGVV